MIVEQLVYADNLTDAEQRIADYILEHPEAVPEMSVHALSGAVHCAPSAIVRFCQKLGCGGYRQFCRELASDLERRRAHGSLVDVDRPFASGQGPREVAGSIAYALFSIYGLVFASDFPESRRHKGEVARLNYL